MQKGHGKLTFIDTQIEGKPQIIRRVRARLGQADLDWIKSLRIGGSIGRDSFDAFSDIDLFIVAREGVDVTLGLRRMAGLLGPYFVIDIPRSSPIWGTWITGVFEDFGYVDICAFASEHSGLTYMTDPSSLVLIDRGGNMRNSLDGLPTTARVQTSFLQGHIAQAWLKIYKAGKELSRSRTLQFEKYLLESLEGIVAIYRAAKNECPTGNNWEQPLRDLEVQLPTLASKVKSAIRPVGYAESLSGSEAKRRLLNTLNLYRSALKLLSDSGHDVSDVISDCQLIGLEKTLGTMFSSSGKSL